MANLHIITDPVTGNKYSRDLSVSGSTYAPYKAPASSPASSPTAAPSSTTTTSPIGSTQRTNELLGGQYFDPNTGKQVSPFTPDYSGVSNMAEANVAINAGQQEDAAKVSSTGEPEVRRTTEDIMSEISGMIAPTKEKPEADFAETYLNYRTQYGVGDLENQLNDLRAQEQDLLSIKESRVAAERGKTVATNVIEGRISETERQENERITAVQRSISSLTNQLNTKYGVIDSLMNLKKLDYDAAVDSYDKQMSNNISVFNAAKNIEEAEKSEIDKAKDNALSSAQILLNSYKDAGLTYDQLSPADQTNLTKLGVQSGLGSNFFSSVLKVSSGKDILTTIVSADDTTASIIYKDGSTKTIATGLPKKSTTEDITEGEKKTFLKQSMEAELKKVLGNDGYISPESWATARRNWTTNTAYTSADFDDAFRGYVNPSHPQDYAGFESYKSGFIKKSSAELEAGE